jgi:transposase
MPKKYLPYDPNQSLLLPPDLNDWLPEDHLARFIDEFVDNLDISEIMDYYEVESRGAPPYDPRMMVKIRMYADCVGTPSSRVIGKSMYENIGFRFLGANNFPDFRTISEFRKIHHESLADLFHQVLTLCELAGLVKMGTVAIDGTKIKANASMDKNYTLETLTKKEERYKEIARKIIEEGIQTDEEEDRIFGPENNGWSMPKDALERVKRAKEELERKKREELEEYKRLLEERQKKEEETSEKIKGRKPKHPKDKKQKSKDGKPKEPVANTTDLDSRIMKTRKGFIQGYNPQIAVDADTQVILATDLTQDHNDVHQLAPMLEQTIENTGKIPEHATADAGYDNEEQIGLFDENIDIYIPTQKDWKQRKAMRDQPPPKGRIPKHLSKRERRERKLLTKKGKKIYKKRGSSVEAVIGQIKSAMGLDKLLLRGKEKGNSEWKMYCTAHNILKLWRNLVKITGC